MAEKEFSREEVQGTIFYGAPQQSMAMPVEQKTTASIPVPPPLTIKNVEKGKPVPNKINAPALVETVGSANKQLQELIPKPEAPSAIHNLVEEISNNWKPLAIIGGVTAAALVGKRLLNRKEATAAPSTRIEPTFATPEETATFKPIEQPTAPSKLAIESEAKFGAPLADVENHFGVKITNLRDAEILTNNYKNSLPQGMTPGIPTGQPNVSVNPAGAFTQPSGYGTALPTPVLQPGQFDPSRIGQPLQDPLAGGGFQTPAQEIGPRPSLKQAVDSGVDAGQALKSDLAGMVDEASRAPVAPPTVAAPVAPVAPTELRTGTGKPAFAGEGPEPKISARTNKPQFKDIYTDVSQVPKGYAFVPNAQYIDIPRQDLGQAEYTKAYTGKDFPATNELAREQSKEINRTLGRATREEAKLAGLAPAEVTPGITKMTTAGKKRVMVGGALGALIALPELASAATQAGQGNVAPAKEMSFDLATGAMLAKLFGGPAAAAGSLALGSSGLNAGEEQELARRRAVQEYSQRVGAGRGIAPPSAYQR